MVTMRRRLGRLGQRVKCPKCGKMGKIIELKNTYSGTWYAILHKEDQEMGYFEVCYAESTEKERQLPF